MIYSQVFKTAEGCRKRARFENQHSSGRYIFSILQFRNGRQDVAPFDPQHADEYTWRLNRESVRRPRH